MSAGGERDSLVAIDEPVVIAKRFHQGRGLLFDRIVGAIAKVTTAKIAVSMAAVT